MHSIPRIILTPGEPAGIGPELAVKLAGTRQAGELVAIADPALLEATARRLRVPLRVRGFDPEAPPEAHEPGSLAVLECELARPASPGKPDPANARYVLDTLDRACELCLAGTADALVTGPVHKGVIADAGFPFTGHTEYLGQACGTARPVMMLLGDALRVVPATTHLPLSQVSAALTADHLQAVLRTTFLALQADFGISAPRILVLGLNPHAGEGGHLGREEIEVISPVLEDLRREGVDLTGPVPADTAFTPQRLEGTDAYVAMYHDQGLPVLKALKFGRAVNVTLGLPIVRTSVDHGTGLDIAGQGRADVGSFQAALDCALRIAQRRQAA